MEMEIYMMSFKFKTEHINLYELTKTIVEKALAIKKFDIGFRNGIILSHDDVAIELRLNEDWSEPLVQLEIDCGFKSREGLDTCLIIAGIAFSELFNALQRSENKSQSVDSRT